MSDDHERLVVYPAHFALDLAFKRTPSINSVYNAANAIALIEDSFPFVPAASLSRLPLRNLELCLRRASAAGLLDEAEDGYHLRHLHNEQLVLDLWQRDQKAAAGRASGRARRKRAQQKKGEQIDLLRGLVMPEEATNEQDANRRRTPENGVALDRGLTTTTESLKDPVVVVGEPPTLEQLVRELRVRRIGNAEEIARLAPVVAVWGAILWWDDQRAAFLAGTRAKPADEGLLCHVIQQGGKPGYQPAPRAEEPAAARPMPQLRDVERAGAAWTGMLVVIRETVPEEVVATWFASLEPVTIEDQVLYLEAPLGKHKWLPRRFGGLFEAASQAADEVTRVEVLPKVQDRTA